MHAHRYGSMNVYCKGSSRASWRNLSAISCSCQTRAPRTSRIGFFNAPSTSTAGSSSGSATFNAILARQCQSQCKYIIFYQWLLANHGTMTLHFISRGIQSNHNNNNNNNKNKMDYQAGFALNFRNLVIHHPVVTVFFYTVVLYFSLLGVIACLLASLDSLL